jgi:tRNA pseudouridine38-40 synthase
MMQRYKLTLEFDGRNFMGWQRQTIGPSVQGALEAAIERICQTPVTVHGAGRTDAGVHAIAMVAHADIEKNITPFKLMDAINYHLRQSDICPGKLVVLDCEMAPVGFHARFSATKRRYEYRIINRRAPLALQAGQAWHVLPKLDAAAMHDAAQCLVGTHDFNTFRSAHCQSKTSVKSLDKLNVSRYGADIIIEAEARSFLHHQVRSMVGCLKLVGEGKWTAWTLQKALDARDRTKLGFNAPAEGLYFVGADYASSDEN